MSDPDLDKTLLGLSENSAFQGQEESSFGATYKFIEFSVFVRAIVFPD